MIIVVFLDIILITALLLIDLNVIQGEYPASLYTTRNINFKLVHARLK